MRQKSANVSGISPLPGLASLPDRIASILRREIDRRYSPRDRLPTTRVLAKQFDVSVNTIQQALAILGREGLVEAWVGSGTFVSDKLKKKVVGLLTDLDILHPSGSFFFQRSVLHHLRRLISNEGYRVKIYLGTVQPNEMPGELSCPDFLDDVVEGKLSGVVTLATAPQPSWMSWLEKTGVPVVGDDEHYKFQVGVDTLAAVKTGVMHLIAQGRRRIAFMGWFARDRHNWQEGVNELLRSEFNKHGVAFLPEWVSGDFHPLDCGAGWAEFREIWMALPEKPDGLMICDDALLPDAAVAMAELGISVPEQLMVVTHANKDAVRRWPFPVTRIEYDPLTHAEATARMLVSLMRGKPVPMHQVHIMARLIESEGQVSESKKAHSHFISQ